MMPAVAVGLTFGNGFILNYIILYAKLESCGVRCAHIGFTKVFLCVCIRRMCEGLCSERKEGCQKEVSENPIS